jgi:hypothetical protein
MQISVIINVVYRSGSWLIIKKPNENNLIIKKTNDYNWSHLKLLFVNVAGMCTWSPLISKSTNLIYKCTFLVLWMLHVMLQVNNNFSRSGVLNCPLSPKNGYFFRSFNFWLFINFSLLYMLYATIYWSPKKELILFGAIVLNNDFLVIPR